MKKYTITGSTNLEYWMQLNRQQIHVDILEAIQNSIKYPDFVTIQVSSIKFKEHIVNIDIGSINEAIDALNKCLSYFLETEQYELAIVARDCLNYYIQNY
jgi:hypothetical protein